MTQGKLGALIFPLLIAMAWSTILLIRLMPVGGSWIELDQITWFVVTFCVVIYFGAMFLGISSGVSKIGFSNPLPSNWLNRWVCRLSFLSSVGALLIIFEFAIMRGYGFSIPVAIIRQMEVDAASEGFEGSWLSGSGRMLTPALMVAWILAVLGWSVVFRRTAAILSITSAVVMYQQIMFEGGRFYLAALLVMTFLAKISTNQYNFKRSSTIGKLLPWVILFIAICSAFGYVFVDRYQQSNRDFVDAYEVWAANFDLEVNDEVIWRMSGDMASTWLAVCMLWVYLTQGLNELNSLLVSSSPDLAWGAMQFPQIAQMLNKVFDLQLRYNELGNLPKVGTYITLYGASYVDFGHLGAFIFMSVVGLITGGAIGQLYFRRMNGRAVSAPILITLGIFAPIVSLVVNLWPAFCWALFVGCSLKFSAPEIDGGAPIAYKKL